MPTKSPAKKTATKKKSQPESENTADPALREFFVDEIKDIYWAEKKLVTALPKMAKAAGTQELKDAITDHLEATKVHVSRLEQVFELLGEKAQAKKCDAMAGILEEGNGIVEETEAGTATRDVGIILASQKVEHYEIATYGGLATLAATLGLTDVKEILGQTLSEEKDADQLLTDIAENSVNYEAAAEVEA
ncbi:ferritin-like domain-containing protein [Sediminibacterium roseum]|uniref:Ferritin-like domain-containing protein n=1 Tax=Sediminibacterium roseum TaxID=1978412 RepID=A0ABW9ZTP3_9BACT|nr:ferritin-like domain-containing protein [Sediminibacterium roseum]NCI50501.1 ferritin-like domain-containing protein [Sediminibacterium roseum]